MRILKRNLAFVLVLAMALGLMVTANAAGVKDYKDSDDITYVEAVDTLTALGVLEGNAGNFMPTDTLTREQGAKIVAYLMLGQKAADNLTTSKAPFDDVAANRWSAGYIAYCVSENIVGGYGNGKFGPADQLTATQFAKMLLCAVGYNQLGEFNGPNWESAVNSLALKLDIFDGNEDVVLSNPCKREEAALYAFNTLTGVMTVKYSKDAEEYYSGTVFNSIRKFDEDYTLGAELYNLNSKGTVDDFGRASHYWAKKNNKITDTYHDDPDATYTKEVKSSAIYADLGLTKTVMATVVRNGKDQPDFQLKKGLGTKIGGNGVLVEAYLDEDEENVTLVVIDTYLAKVTADSEDGETEVEIYMAADDKKASVYETGVEYNKDDYVLVTYADGDIQSMKLAEKEVGKLDTVGSNYVNLEGTKYTKSANWFVNEANYDDTLAVVLDEYGYMIGLVVEEEAEDELDGYVYVLRDQGRGDSLLTTRAAVVEVLYLDGTGIEVLPLPTRVKTVDGVKQTQFKAEGKWSKVDNKLGLAGAFYGYYLNDDDEVVLVALDKDEAKAVYGANVKFNKKTSGDFGGDTSFVLNSKTQLVTVNEDDGKINTVTGYKNINVTEDNANALMVFNKKLANTIYVLDADLVTDDVYAFFNGTSYQNSKGTWVTLFVDGETVNYKFSDNKLTSAQVKADMAEGAYIIETKDDELTSWSSLKYSDINLKSEKVLVTASKDLYFQTADGYHYYAEDAKIYDITDDGVEGSVEKNDYVVFENNKDNKTLVTKVWVVGHEDKEVKPDTVAGSTKVTYTNLTNNTVDIVVENAGDKAITVKAYRMVNNSYNEFGGFEFDGTTFTYTGSEATDLYIDVFVGGVKADRIGPFSFDAK